MKKLLLLCGVALILSGCAAKGNFELGISSDKNVDFGMTIAYDDELIEVLMSMGSTDATSEVTEYTDEQKWEFVDTLFVSEDGSSPESLGFTGERYQEEDYKGYTYTKNVGNIDSITADDASFNLISDYLEISESKLFAKNGDNYVSKITFTSAEETEGYQIESNITFTVTLPNKPISHNADSVSEDGKTLTWELTTNSPETIDFEFNFSSFPLIPVIIGAAALLIIIIVVIVIVAKGKKGPKNPESQTNEVKTENISTPANVEPTNPVTTPVENNQATSEINEVKPMDLNQEPKQEVNVQPLEKPVQPVNPVQNVTEVKPVSPTGGLNQVNPTVQAIKEEPVSQPINMNNTPNVAQANVSNPQPVSPQVKPEPTVQTNSNLESVTTQNPKVPDQSFLNSSSNAESVEKSTAPTVEDLLNSTPKRDN